MMGLIMMSENDSMSCHLLLDSVVLKDNRVQLIEIVNLKKPQHLGGDKLSLSSKIFEVIDLNTIEQTIYHMEIYEDLFAEGQCWASGEARQPTRSIPVESLSYKNYLFLRKHLGYSD
jgi:hypothetical protein